MAIARNVNIEKISVAGPVPDAVYNITGEGAENIRTVLQDIKTPYEKFRDGFAVKESTLMTMEPVFGRIFHTDLEKAIAVMNAKKTDNIH